MIVWYILFVCTIVFVICLCLRHKEGFLMLDDSGSAEKLAKRIFAQKMYGDRIKPIRVYNNYQQVNSLSNKYINVMIDGEPHDQNMHHNFDLVITTKEYLNTYRPQTLRAIYVPFYSQAFAEMYKYSPDDLYRPRGLVPKSKFCAFMYSNCDVSFPGVQERETFFELLNGASGGKVEALGKCRSKGNGRKKNPSKNYLEEAIELYRPFKFVICFENTLNQGYITEKIILALLAGCVPIYLGAPNVSFHISPETFISYREFASPQDCIDRIMKLNSESGRKEYEEMVTKPCMKEETVRKHFSWYYGGEFYSLLNIFIPSIIFMKYPRIGTTCESNDSVFKVINLDSSVDRLNAIRDRAKKAGISFDRFPAILGSNYLSKYRGLIHWKVNRPMRTGELGIYLSSLELYCELLKDSRDYYVICEDDVFFTPEIRKISSIVNNCPEDWDMIFLGTNKEYCKKENSDKSYSRLTGKCMPGAFGYVIRKKCAQYFVNFGFPMEEPIDGLFMRNFENLNVYEYSPNCVFVDYDDKSTTIHNSDEV